ncbi:hypothetical protein ACFQRC_10955 [Enterovirga sp. GCM10030262]|uniref:hypothetical protein n=1 Tax=Enterovirga sp. GCM10030262 TaxID=3273391 RepID=UPI003608440C
MHPPRPILLATLAAMALTPPLLAQSAEKPLGEILESIEEASEAPAAPPRATPVPIDGIGTTALPPSQIQQSFDPVADDGEFEAEPEAVVPELTEAERLALWEAAERARLDALDRARAERAETARLAREAALARHERQLAERDAAIARAQADYQAALERTRLQAERDHALWEARVRACRSGDRDQCARPGEY